VEAPEEDFENGIVLPYIDPEWARQVLAEYYRGYEPPALAYDDEYIYPLKQEQQLSPEESKMYTKLMLKYLQEQNKYQTQRETDAEEEEEEELESNRQSNDNTQLSENEVMDDMKMDTNEKRNVKRDVIQQQQQQQRRRRSSQY